jgi:hypothetical protein
MKTKKLPEKKRYDYLVFRQLYLLKELHYDCCNLNSLNFSINLGTTSNASPTIP